MLKDLKLEECAVPCNAGSMTEEHVYNALRIIRDKPKPLLIHCWHGSDRTGTVVAAFRIVFNGQEVETAIAEMREEKYGHHADIYGNLPELLRAVDWEKDAEPGCRPRICSWSRSNRNRCCASTVRRSRSG